MALIVRDLGLLFIMAPHTGCTAIGEVLRERFDAQFLPPDDVLAADGTVRIARKHTRLQQLLDAGLLSATERSGLVVAAGVRNPFDEEVSHYKQREREFSARRDDPEVRKRLAGSRSKSQRPPMEFETWLRRRYVGHPWSKLLGRTPKRPADFTAGADAIIRFERLQADVDALMTRLGVPEPVVIPVVNATGLREKRPYQEFYTPRAREIVETVFAERIARFGYRFEAPPAAPSEPLVPTGHMSELRPSTPAQRPDTARPREDAEPVIEPPSPVELERIQRHLVSLPVHSGGELVEDPTLGALLIHQRDRGPGGNYAAMPRWTAEGWRESLAAVDGTLRGWGEWPSMLLANKLDRPIGLERAIADLGWSSVLRETVLWVGRASVVPHLDPRMRIEAVQPDRVADHEALERRVFGLPEARAEERRAATAAALAGGQLRAYVVRVDEEPVAVARLSQGEGVAGIYAVGVAERWRRQGYGALITIVATRAGMAMGNRLVWLSVEDGNDVARRVYTRLGFQEAFSWARWLALVE